MNEIIVNKSLTYILPLIDIWEPGFILVPECFRGCFVKVEDYPELDNHIFLLYKFSGEKWYLNFEQSLKDSDYYVNSIEPDRHNTIYVFDVPAHQQINYDFILESKYSKLSETYKNRVLTFLSQASSDVESVKAIKGVLYKEDYQYKSWENTINKDLPYSQHIKIPRDLEAGSIFDTYGTEMFKNSDKIVSGLSKLRNDIIDGERQ